MRHTVDFNHAYLFVLLSARRPARSRGTTVCRVAVDNRLQLVEDLLKLENPQPRFGGAFFAARDVR